MWDEQAAYFPLPTCTCGEVAAKLQAMRDEEHFQDFMYGLNVELYGHTRSNLLAHQTKQTRDIFSDSSSRALRCFELIYCDLWGPYSVPSSSGARYFLTLVDDFSRVVWIILLKDKTVVYFVFFKFIALVKRQFGADIRCVRSDNGTEFYCLRDHFSTQDILFQTSYVGTPQQNGRVERKHRHILNVARALRFQRSLSVDFWGVCAKCLLFDK